MEIAIEILIGGIAATAAITGLAVRTWVRKRIEHQFQTKLEAQKAEHIMLLEKLKAEHAADLESLKANNAQVLEATKTELALISSGALANIEIQKDAFKQAVAIRSQYFPLLVGILRKTKRQCQDLYNATAEYPTDLSCDASEAQLVKNSFSELMSLKEMFEEALDEVRVFITRSEFALPRAIGELVPKWQKSTGDFSISKEIIARLYDAYADDISFLAEAFFKPDLCKSGTSASELLSRQNKQERHEHLRSRGYIDNRSGR